MPQTIRENRLLVKRLPENLFLGPTLKRCSGVAIGLALDRAFGEPPNPVHPVVRAGHALSVLENRTYRDARPAGVVHLAIAASTAWAIGTQVERRLGPMAGTAVSVWLASAPSMLHDEARAVGDHLARDDLARARQRLPSLVGRDPAALDESQIVRAVIESVAENTVDAATSTIFWAQLLGPAGVWTHRIVNTLDAMVGHHSAHYRQFGWASALTDDVVNYLPARLTAAAVAAVGSAPASQVLRTVRRDAKKHPSPNGGQIEAAAASALGISLGGVNTYGDRVEDRGILGEGPPPGVSDIEETISLMDRATALLVVVPGALALACSGIVYRLLRPGRR